MNILILNWRDVRHPKSGGAEIVTMEHAKGWVKAGHSVTWLTASYPGATSQAIVDGVRFIRRWSSLSIYLYAPLYLLRHSKNVDVVVDEVHGFPFFSPLFTTKPVVVFIHEIAGEIWDFMFPFPKNIAGKLLERWYFRLYRNNFFWTDAESTVRELVARGIPRKQCLAIPCPIVKPTGLEFRARKKRKHPTFIFTSRVVRMKGVEEVIKAFSFIARSLPDASLWIVGGGEEEYLRELHLMTAEYGVQASVRFWGNVSDKLKLELMAEAHILLHASVKEGWGLVALEAAAVGTPSIVYDVSGLRDVVKNQITGVVLQHSTPIDMAREAVTLLSDRGRYKKFQINAKKWVKSLTWKDVIGQSLVLLEKAKGKMV